MERQLKTISLLAAGVALIALPILSGRVELGFQAAVILAILLVIAFAVKGVRVQRNTLRQQNVDIGAIKRTIRTLDEVIAAIEAPVMGASSQRAVFTDSNTAVQILTKHRFTSIPTPASDAEVVARIEVLAQDGQFMSLLRSNSARSRLRWQQHLVGHSAKLPSHVAGLSGIEAHLAGIEGAKSSLDLLTHYWPGLMAMYSARQECSTHLPAEG